MSKLFNPMYLQSNVPPILCTSNEIQSKNLLRMNTKSEQLKKKKTHYPNKDIFLVSYLCY